MPSEMASWQIRTNRHYWLMPLRRLEHVKICVRSLKGWSALYS